MVRQTVLYLFLVSFLIFLSFSSIAGDSIYNPLTDPPVRGAKLISPDKDAKAPAWIDKVSFELKGDFYSVGVSRWCSSADTAKNDALFKALWPVALRIRGMRFTEQIVQHSTNTGLSSDTINPERTEDMDKRMLIEAAGVQLDQVASIFPVHWRKGKKHYYKCFLLGQIPLKKIKKIQEEQAIQQKKARKFIEDNLRVRLFLYRHDDSGTPKLVKELQEGDLLRSGEEIRFQVDASRAEHVNYMIILNVDDKEITNLFPGTNEKLIEGHYLLDSDSIRELNNSLFVANSHPGRETFYFIFLDKRNPEVEHFICKYARDVKDSAQAQNNRIVFRGVTRVIKNIFGTGNASEVSLAPGFHHHINYLKTLSGRFYTQIFELNHIR